MSLQNPTRAGIAARRALVAAVLASAIPLSAHAAGLRVVQDPLSGELRGPTAAEAEAFAKAEAALRASTRAASPTRATGPKEIRYADGTVEMKMDEDTMMYSVVTAGADGSLDMQCLPAAEARKVVKATRARKPSTVSIAKAGHEHP